MKTLFSALATVLVLVGCSGGGEEDFVDPRSVANTEISAAAARENIAGLVTSIQDMVKSGEMSSLGEFCEEMVPTFEGYAVEESSPHTATYASLLNQWKELTAAAKASDKSKITAAIKGLTESLEKLPAE